MSMLYSTGCVDLVIGCSSNPGVPWLFTQGNETCWTLLGKHGQNHGSHFEKKCSVVLWFRFYAMLNIVLTMGNHSKTGRDWLSHRILPQNASVSPPGSPRRSARWARTTWLRWTQRMVERDEKRLRKTDIWWKCWPIWLASSGWIKWSFREHMKTVI